jgi:hypothetical protein
VAKKKNGGKDRRRGGERMDTNMEIWERFFGFWGWNFADIHFGSDP